MAPWLGWGPPGNPGIDLKQQEHQEISNMLMRIRILVTNSLLLVDDYKLSVIHSWLFGLVIAY